MNAKKIVNIINFVRAEDPRVEQSILYGTFKNQVDLCRSYPMPYTFLMQYDAFVRPEYVRLLTEKKDPNMEIGVWVELAQEQVERVGIKWDGREGYKWDWHVHPGMLMGYGIPERKLLIDELMNRFYEVFGYYPKSVGSWLLDSWSIAYMAETYHIDAFIICKEQFGTDGYTLWGGYYNQAYFPSKKNMFVPAQTEYEQINTPVIRMLGPDPIYQYDFGLDENYAYSHCQHVMTIEPVWECGQNPDWVDWYLHSTFEEEFLNMAYTQTGQENPFTWERFGEGLIMQMEKLYDGYKSGRFEVLSMGETGRWFTNTFRMTPATAMTALEDWKNEGKQTVWYNCKRYRANILSEKNGLLLRDLFLFDENYEDRYWKEIATGSSAVYDTLPIVDGYRWGGKGIRSGWHFVNCGTHEKANGRIVSTERLSENDLKVNVKINGAEASFVFHEDSFTINFGNTKTEMLFLHNSLEDTEIKEITADSVTYCHNNMLYGFQTNGKIQKTENGYRMTPENGRLRIDFFAEKRNCFENTKKDKQ